VGAASRGVVAVGEPEADGGELVAEGAQDAGLADPGIAGEEHRLARVERFGQGVDERLLGGREPESGVLQLLGERVSRNAQSRTLTS
jgi:hypothetical protein